MEQDTTSVGSGERASLKDGGLSFLTTDSVTIMGVLRSSMSPDPNVALNKA